MADQDRPVPITFATYEDYWARRHEEPLWAPWFRWALELAELPAAPVLVLRPSQYPTARCGTVIVTIYPGFSHVFEREREAHRLLAAHPLPVPHMIAAGTFPRDGQTSWHWLIESIASGSAWSAVSATLSQQSAHVAATATGTVLRRLHSVEHTSSSRLKADWAAFDDLITDEVEHLGEHDGRLRLLPERLHPQLRDLARATGTASGRHRPPALLHGDVHADNVFIDPAIGALTGLIDLNEMLVGDPWYDLADGVFRLLHGRPGLTQALLRGYGALEGDPVALAVRLLGWGLVHDFDGLTTTAERRGLPGCIDSVESLALHLTGLRC